jgi:hypothetical protein
MANNLTANPLRVDTAGVIITKCTAVRISVD